MKLRRLPEDFQVEELTRFQPSQGPFALYRLTKRSLGTPEAVEAVLRRWKVPRQRVSYGGLKDRHAVTVQHLTIRGGPRRDLRETSFHLDYLGQAPRSFGPQDVEANRFQIVLRDLTEEAARQAAAELAAAAAAADGMPNYFDDQRFGSLGESGEFIARPWCLGDYERALWLALADPNPHDRPQEREEKRLLRECWGDWGAGRARLARSHRRSVVTYLADHPADFRGALARLRVDLRGLYLSAFQSAVWNRMLGEWLKRALPAERLVEVPLRLGPVPFFTALDSGRPELRQALLPLPSARLHLEPGPMADLVDAAVRAFGLECREMRVKFPRDSFFSKGERPAIVVPERVSHTEAADELHPARRRLNLSFDLPRGSYATILVKRIGIRRPGSGGDEISKRDC